MKNAPPDPPALAEADGYSAPAPAPAPEPQSMYAAPPDPYSVAYDVGAPGSGSPEAGEQQPPPVPAYTGQPAQEKEGAGGDSSTGSARQGRFLRTVTTMKMGASTVYNKAREMRQ